MIGYIATALAKRRLMEADVALDLPIWAIAFLVITSLFFACLLLTVSPALAQLLRALKLTSHIDPLHLWRSHRNSPHGRISYCYAPPASAKE